MLLAALLLLLNATSSCAQAIQALTGLTLNTVSSFSSETIPDPPVFSLPKSGTLTVTVALCASTSLQPRFFVTNSSISGIPSSALGEDVFEIPLNAGFGTWSGIFDTGGVLAVEGIGLTPFEIGVSTGGPLHAIVSSLPLLGDTTSNQSLIYSSPYSPPEYTKPTYPNYTLPAANITLSSPPLAPNFVLRVFTTSNALTGSIPLTGCAISSESSTGVISSQAQWLRDENGWRTQWLIEGLTPSTNYTTYVVQDGIKVSGPIYFATKSAAFICPLVFNLPYCPRIAYPVPLPPPGDGSTTYTAANIATNVSSTFLSYMANFTVTLTSMACGRDLYSPIVDCDDCEREYRKWLCTIIFTRCGEPSLSNPSAFTSSVAPPNATGLSAPPRGAQQVLSALIPQSTNTSTARSQALPPMGSTYSMLLPCLETCTAVDRACPSFLGFLCPLAKFNAAASYGVGYIDGPDGDERQGVTGVAHDRWGNIWCNEG